MTNLELYQMEFDLICVCDNMKIETKIKILDNLQYLIQKELTNIQ